MPYPRYAIIHGFFFLERFEGQREIFHYIQGIFARSGSISLLKRVRGSVIEGDDPRLYRDCTTISCAERCGVIVEMNHLFIILITGV